MWMIALLFCSMQSTAPKGNHKMLTRLGDRLSGPRTTLSKKLGLRVSIDTLGSSKEQPGKGWHKMLKLSDRINSKWKQLISGEVCRWPQILHSTKESHLFSSHKALVSPHALSMLVALNHEICLCRLQGLRCQHFLLSTIFHSNNSLITTTA